MRKAVALGLVTMALMTVGCSELPVAPIRGNAIDDAYRTAQALKSGKMDSLQVEAICQKPMDYHWLVAYNLFMLDGRTPVEADSLVRAWKNEMQMTATEGSRDGPEPMSVMGSCDQPIEFKTVVRDPVFPYYTNSYQSSRGTEYNYYFRPWWTVDSNNIRWAATDPRVHWAIWVRTCTSGVAGHNLCGKPFNLQLGNNTIGAAGGQYWVMANLYVHHL